MLTDGVRPLEVNNPTGVSIISSSAEEGSKTRQGVSAPTEVNNPAGVKSPSRELEDMAQLERSFKNLIEWGPIMATRLELLSLMELMRLAIPINRQARNGAVGQDTWVFDHHGRSIPSRGMA